MARQVASAQSGLEFYRAPAELTALDGSPLPGDVPTLVRAVQGCVLHEAWAARYGVELPAERRGETHIRRARELVTQILKLDAKPLTVLRPPQGRLVGTCRHFSVLLVALLRRQGVPARARCGFATYFSPGRFEDHWIGEYWSAAEGRWVRVDAQLDGFQREALGLDFSPLDTPPERFLTAGEAWARCRSGGFNPDDFGIREMSGLWFAAGNLVRDLAALNKLELLPWDVWGVLPSPEKPLAAGQLAFFDQIATVLRDPDVSVAELQNLYQDDRLRVPTTVFNAVKGCREAV